jgi:hypothetical protein
MAYRLKPAIGSLRVLPSSPAFECSGKSSRNILMTVEIVIKFTSNASLARLLAASTCFLSAHAGLRWNTNLVLAQNFYAARPHVFCAPHSLGNEEHRLPV